MTAQQIMSLPAIVQSPRVFGGLPQTFIEVGNRLPILLVCQQCHTPQMIILGGGGLCDTRCQLLNRAVIQHGLLLPQPTTLLLYPQPFAIHQRHSKHFTQPRRRHRRIGRSERCTVTNHQHPLAHPRIRCRRSPLKGLGRRWTRQQQTQQNPPESSIHAVIHRPEIPSENCCKYHRAQVRIPAILRQNGLANQAKFHRSAKQHN